MAVLITVIGFGIMIFLHELGHFLTAKKFGVLVHEFAIGMGPKIFSFGKGETKYSVRLFPIGGFVKLEEEIEPESEKSDNPRSFSNLSPGKRIIILVSGAFMNVLLGFLIFVIINSNVGIVPTIVDYIPDSYSAYQNVLQPGDEVIRLNETRVHTNDDVLLFMSRLSPDENISITFKRAGDTQVIRDFTPIETEYGHKIGVSFKKEDASLIKCAQFAVYDTIYITKAVILALGDLLTGRVGVNSLSGPVEIVTVVDAVASQQSKYTFISILYLFAMITVNLGVFNLLPFPALDGGSIIFAFYELITKRKIKSEIVGYAGVIGFALLMLLAIYVTAGDIIALIK